MTKLNLSALKKKADILANPTSEFSTHDFQANSESVALQDLPQISPVTVNSSIVSQVWVESKQGVTEPTVVKEFFPNLNLGDDLFDDILAKKELIMTEEIPQSLEVQSVTPNIGVSDLITPTNGDSSETVVPLPTLVTEVPEADISIVEWAMTEVPSPLESVVAPIEQQEYVKSVAEDLSLEREGGLKRLSGSKKAAIFGLLGLALVWIIGGGLYAFDIFPPTKTSVVEAPPIAENDVPTPVTVVEQTGSLSNTGASTSSWTALPVLTQSGTVETLSGSTLTWSTLVEVTLSWATHSGTTTTGSTLSGASLTGSTLSGTTIIGSTLSGSTLTGSTLTGSTLTGSISTGAVLTKPIPSPNSTGSVTGSSSIIRTPNIRVPLTNTGTLR